MSSTTAGRTTTRSNRDRAATARFAAARAVNMAVTLIVGLIVLGIVLVVLEANRSNGLVEAILDGARWFVSPFTGIFELDSNKAQVAVNWGIGAVVFAMLGSLIARLLAR